MSREATPQLPFTGELYVPELRGTIPLEHLRTGLAGYFTEALFKEKRQP